MQRKLEIDTSFLSKYISLVYVCKLNVYYSAFSMPGSSHQKIIEEIIKRKPQFAN